MPRKLIIFFCLLMIINKLYPQSKFANNWYFGEFAGITFNTSPPSVLANSAMNINSSGAASISDSLGNLLFYSDGETIWNKNHEVMPNSNLIQDALHIPIFVPVPNNPNRFYLITTCFGDETNQEGIYYTLIDKTLNNSLGGIVVKNVPIFRPSTGNVGAFITICKHSNNSDYWLVGTSTLPNLLYLWKISNIGVELVNTSEFLSGQTWLRFSTDGSKFGYNDGNQFNILNFNNTTGVFTPYKQISNEVDFFIFSPNATKIYYTWGYNNISYLYQYDLCTDIITNLSIIEGYCTYQLTPDGRIFFAEIEITTMIHAINNPDESGINCNVQKNVINLNGRRVTSLFPTFVENFLQCLDFFNIGNCSQSNTNFYASGISNYQTVLWNFGDSQTSTELNPTHTYANAGTYTVTLTVTYTNGQQQTVSKRITINPKPSNLTVTHD